MRNIRLYVPAPLQAGRDIELDGQAFQHLAKVLRAQPGQEVTLFNGEGGEFHGKLRALHKRTADVRLERFDPVERETAVALELVQGISRQERMDYTIQKAVELGISRIQPILTKRSVVKLDGARATKRHQHWQGVIASACEQCGRNTLPELLPVMTFIEFMHSTAQESKESALRLILDPEGDASVRSIGKPNGRVQLLAGPEGGLDESETAAAAAADFTRLRLGRRILRTETAALVAAAALFTSWGEFD